MDLITGCVSLALVTTAILYYAIFRKRRDPGKHRPRRNERQW